MKVAVVITRGDDLGGAQMHVSALAEGLRSRGHKVTLFAGNTGAWSDLMQHRGFSFEQIPGMLREISPTRDIRTIRTLARRLRAMQPDLVCAHSSKAGLITRIAARMAHVPCVYTAHGWPFRGGPSWIRTQLYRVIERSTAPLADRIISVSNFDTRIAANIGISTDKLVTVHNGVDDTELRAEPGAGDPVRIVMVARFADPKDHVLLLQAVAQLPEVQLDLVGDGPDLGATRFLAESLGISDRVHFLGNRTDVPEILSRSHIFALTSRFEGFPISTIEAMRAGLPIVVSDVGGAGEAITDGISGFLIPSGDLETLVDRLRLLVTKPDRRDLMGTAARNRWETHYTADTMVNRTIAIYEEILGTQQSHSAPFRPEATHAA